DAPPVRALAGLPRGAAPRVVEGLALLRHGLELPELLAGDQIERSRVTWIRTLPHLRRLRADDRDVAIDRRRAAPRVADSNRSVLTEGGDELAGGGIDLPDPAVRHENNRRRMRRIAGPVADPTL